jgi:Tfp pilus assembly protein PilO
MTSSSANLKKQFLSLIKHEWTVWALRYAVLLVVFLVFYIPLATSASNISKKYNAKAKQIETAKQGGLQVLRPDEMATLLERVQRFENGLTDVSKAALLMAYVSETAAENHFKLTKINSEAASSVTDLEKKEISMGGKKIMRIPINLRFETDYKTFTNFLHQVSNNPKHSVAVETFSLKQKNPPTERILCDLTLSFFVTSSA